MPIPDSYWRDEFPEACAKAMAEHGRVVTEADLAKWLAEENWPEPKPPTPSR